MSTSLAQYFHRITTFEELDSLMALIATGKLGLTIILGAAGVGKTERAKKLPQYHIDRWIGSSATKAGLWEKVRKCPNGFFIFNDAEGYASDAEGKANLKQMMETCGYDPKTGTFKPHPMSRVTKITEDEGTSSFMGRPQALILANKMPNLDEHMEAIYSRAHCYVFDPTREEILKELKTWATEKDVIAEIEKVYTRLREFNFRTYDKALQRKVAEEELKSKGLPVLPSMSWRQWLEKSCNAPTDEQIALLLEADFKAGKISAAQRNELWTKQTGKKYGMLRKIIRKLEQTTR